MNSENVYQILAEMESQGQDGVLATVVKTDGSVPRHAGAKMICSAHRKRVGTIGGGLAEATVIARAEHVLETGQSEVFVVNLTGEHGVCGGTMEIFLEPLQTGIPFFVVGAGHVGVAIAKLGHSLRFRFTLIDDRPELITDAATLLGVRTILATPDQLGDRLVIPKRAVVVVCSRGVDLDGEYLAALLRLEAVQGHQFVFIGSLGSETKAAHIKTSLRSQPDLKETMERVRLPVGLDLGVETPAEIALAILAEAQAVLQGKDPIRDADGRWGYACLGDL